MKNNKIAILILAYQHFEQVLLFLRQFDSELFDLYVHVDRKQTIPDGFLSEISKMSHVYLIPDEKRVSVFWGDSSVIGAERVLLREAGSKHYLFYVFASGQDLLIKPSKDFYSFLVQNQNHWFNRIVAEEELPTFRKRVEIRYSKSCMGKDRKSVIRRNLKKLITGGRCHTFAFLKTKFSKSFDFRFGSEWVSFHDEIASYILKKEEEDDSLFEGFQTALVPDESYYQTMIKSSPYWDSLIPHNLTYLEFPKGSSSPLVFREKNLPTLLSQEDFYLARKFDSTVDERIVTYLTNTFRGDDK